MAFSYRWLDESNKVGADVILPHGHPQSCMPNPVKGFFKVHEHMIKMLLMLQVPLADDS